MVADILFFLLAITAPWLKQVAPVCLCLYLLFLPPVRLPPPQVLEIYVNDSSLTGRPKVGKAVLALTDLPRDGKLSLSLPLLPVNAGQQAQGEVLLDVSFKVFEDDEQVCAVCVE